MYASVRIAACLLTAACYLQSGRSLSSCCAQSIATNVAATTTRVTNESNPIQLENQHPGARDWQLTRVRLDSGGFRSPWIEGYCSRQSVKAGETIDIFVSTKPVRQFRVEFFRMGLLRWAWRSAHENGQFGTW